MSSVTALNQPVAGLVLEVSKYPTGSYLASAHTSSATTLNVEDTTDFDPAGGKLVVNGVQYTYSSIDEVTDQIFMPVGLATALEATEPVLVFPYSDEKWALVQTDPHADAVRARIPHNLTDKFVLGIRTDDDRESVIVVIERTSWTIQDIVALAPEIDGGYLMTASIPVGAVSFDAGDIGANQIYHQITAPTVPNIDDVWIDSSLGNIMKRWNGTLWVLIDDARIAQTVTGLTTKNTVFSQASAPSTIGRVTGDIWIDTDDTDKVYQWRGAWVLTDLASSAYVISRGTDLVANGTGTLGNNYNFTQLVFSTADTPVGAAGSFVTTTGVSSAVLTDEFMPVDPNKEFLLSYQAKQKGTTGYLYGGLAPYDAFKLSIDPAYNMYIANTLTTLAIALNPGDTTITLTSSANWYGLAAKPAGANVYLRRILWWDYTDPGGKVWPELTYSRNVTATNFWADGGITGNVITLAAPYAGPAKAAGTKLSNGTSGGSYMYGGAINAVVPTSWTPYSASVKGVITNGTGSFMGPGGGWPIGVGYCKIVFLPNRTVSGPPESTSQHAVALVSFSDASAANTVAQSALTLAGHITTYYQTSQPASGMLSGDLWIDTDDGNKVYFYNGTTWTVAQDQGIGAAITAAAGAQATADGKVRTFAQISAPTGMLAGDDGDLWIDTDDQNKLYRWSGSAWVLLQDTSIAAAQSTATTALNSANAKNKVTYSTLVSGTTANAIGDVWFQRDGSNRIIGQWIGLGGTSWQATTLSYQVIASIDAGTITVGTLTGISITGVTITGATIKTAATGARWELSGGVGATGIIKGFHSSADLQAEIAVTDNYELNPALEIFAPLNSTGGNTGRAGLSLGSQQGTSPALAWLNAADMDIACIGFEASRVSLAVAAGAQTPIQFAAPYFESGVHGWARVATSGANSAFWVCPKDGIYTISFNSSVSVNQTGRAFVNINAGAKQFRFSFGGTSEAVCGGSVTAYIPATSQVSLDMFCATAATINGGQIFIYKAGVPAV